MRYTFFNYLKVFSRSSFNSSIKIKSITTHFSILKFSRYSFVIISIIRIIETLYVRCCIRNIRLYHQRDFQ
jgi:hypothetical protein